MKDSDKSRVYAKALLELASDSNVDIVNEFNAFTELVNSSTDLENLLGLDVFTIEERTDVLKELFKRENYSQLLQNFIFFLVEEKRTSFLQLVHKDLVVIDDAQKGFLRGTVEGTDETSDAAVLDKIKQFLKEKLGIIPELNYVKNGDIKAGYRVTVQDYQIDATLEGQLEKLENETN
jgi:F-type H+-transporting ATPase subunit delta